jgi:hypothetical protein
MAISVAPKLSKYKFQARGTIPFAVELGQKPTVGLRHRPRDANAIDAVASPIYATYIHTCIFILQRHFCAGHTSSPAKTSTYGRKYLTRRSLVLYSRCARLRQTVCTPAGIDLSALQYAIPNTE